MAEDPATLEALLAALTEDSRSLLRSLRARAQAAGLGERFEPGRGGRGELALTLGGAELARLLLRPKGLPRIAFAAPEGAPPEEPREIAGLRDAAAAGERLRAAAEERAKRAPQLDLFGRGPRS